MPSVAEWAKDKSPRDRAAKFALVFAELRGQDESKIQSWAAEFLPLVEKYPLEDLIYGVRWAFEREDGFWLERLYIPKNVVKNIDTILSQFRSDKKTQTALVSKKKHEWTGTQTWHESRKYIICGPCTICNKTIEEHFPRFWTTHG